MKHKRQLSPHSTAQCSAEQNRTEVCISSSTIRL